VFFVFVFFFPSLVEIWQLQWIFGNYNMFNFKLLGCTINFLFLPKSEDASTYNIDVL